MSSYIRGRDTHGLVHYCFGKQGQHHTLDPWCWRHDQPQNYGALNGVMPASRQTLVTCLRCLGLRAYR